MSIGHPLMERSPLYPPAVDLPMYGEILTPASSPFTTAPLVTSPNFGNGAWLSINDPFAVPFILPRNETVYQLGWWNGTAGDNADVGIYSSSFARIVSTGSTACVTSNVPQVVDIADTVLTAGTLYYLVGSRDTITASRIGRWTMTSALPLGLVGCMASTTDSFPLPDPLVGMTLVSATWTTIPVYVMALRTLV